MRRGITELRAEQLKRLERRIRKAGPIGWREASLVLAARPDRFTGLTLQEFVAAGSLVQLEQGDGSSLLGLPA